MNSWSAEPNIYYEGSISASSRIPSNWDDPQLEDPDDYGYLFHMDAITPSDISEDHFIYTP